MAEETKVLEKTMWGNLKAYIGEVDGDASIDLGEILQNGITLAVQDGESKSILNYNGDVEDELTKAPSLTFTVTIIKPSDSTMDTFWKTKAVTNGVQVDGLVSVGNKSLRIGSDEEGSVQWVCPKVSIAMKPDFGENGILGQCTFKLLKSETKGLFSFLNKVAAEVPANA